MLLSLPFSYDADVTPKYCRNAHRTSLRDYVRVHIRELGENEVEPAIEIHDPSAPASREVLILSPEGRLMATARDSRTGEALSSRAFEAAVGLSGDASHRIDFDLYPDGAAQHGSALREVLHRRTLRQYLDYWNAKGLRSIDGDRDFRELEAFNYLPESVVIVDGSVYMECREPVWTIAKDQRDRVPLRLERKPNDRHVQDEFRLDRLEAARSWARLAGVDAEPRATAAIASDRSLKRDDHRRLAEVDPGYLTGMWSTLAEGARLHYSPVIADFIERSHAAGDMSLEAMDAFVTVFQRVVTFPNLDWDINLHIARRMERWIFEREHGLSVEPPMEIEFSEDDLYALVFI